MLKLLSCLLLCCGTLLIAAAAPVELAVSLSEHGKIMHGKIKVANSIPGKKLKCEIAVSPASGKVRPEQTQVIGSYPLPANRVLDFKCNLPDLPERTRFTATVRILNAAGAEISQCSTPFATPPAPNWQGFTGGIPDGTVPEPWTKVVKNGNTVEVWGRKFIFDNTPLPVQIVSQNINLLKAPARVVLDPAPQSWQLLKSEQPDDTTVRFIWQGRINDKHAYKAITEVYFDGVVRFDLEMPEQLTAKKYMLEFPVDARIARTLHRGPWGFGGYKTSYRVKQNADYHPIRPQLFLYNNDVGFGWFDGMQFDWKLKNPQRALEVVPADDKVYFRVNYIDQQTFLKQKRLYSCGLQPLPVRPLPREEKGLRMCYALTYADVDKAAWKGTVDYLADGNIRREQGTAEMSIKLDEKISPNTRELFFFETAHGNLRFRFGWNKANGIFAQVFEHYQSRAIVKTNLHPAPGKWTHLAVTWGDEIAVFADGKKAGSTKWKGSISAFPTHIYAGGVDVSVDNFRISDIARKNFAADQPATVDKHTLLLDNFETLSWCNGRRCTVPEKISDSAEAGFLTPDTLLTAARWGQGIAPMKKKLPNMIEGYRRYGIDTFCFHASQYTDEAMAGMYIADPQRMRRTVNEIHRTGGRAVIYINNSLSNYDRAWDTHKDDWLIKPAGYPFIAAHRPKEKSYQACPRSEYINYFFWRLDALFREYKLDGAFLDGRMYSKCGNREHGCGAVNFEGKFVPQRNVWDGRLKAWRLYNIIKSHNGYGEQHKSSIWDAPTCFFWDAAWEGEQFMLKKLKPGEKRLDTLPLEAMHEHINGRVYGMPSRYTAYLGQPFTAVENCTFSFVHGTTWTMTYRIDEAAVIAPYWHALDKFGADNWNFRGYWESIPPASEVPDELLKVSAHVKTDSALVMIANFNEDQPFVSGKIRLQLDKLGFAGPYRAKDAFSGEEIPVNGNEIDIKVKSFRQSWIIFEKL